MPRKFVHIAMSMALVLFASASIAASSKSGGEEDDLQVATFAGGCFWCVEADFDNVPGVVRTISGYTGGTLIDPTYEQVSADITGHREAVQIYFDPSTVSYAMLLERLLAERRSDRSGRPVLRPGSELHDRHIRQLTGAERAGGRQQARARAVCRPRSVHRHLDRSRRAVLSGGGLPPGLLQEEAVSLQGLPLWLRPRRPDQGPVG